ELPTQLRERARLSHPVAEDELDEIGWKAGPPELVRPELESGNQRQAALLHHRGQRAIPGTAVERGREGAGEDVDAALDGHARASAVRGMREHELAAAMTHLDGRSDDVDRHHHDRARRGPGTGEELDDIATAPERGIDEDGVLRTHELRDLRGKDVEGAPPGRREAGARREDRRSWHLAAFDAAPERECVLEVGPGVDDVDDAVRREHGPQCGGERFRGQGVHRAEGDPREVDVAVPEAGRDCPTRAVDDPGVRGYVDGPTGADGRDEGVLYEDHPV